MGEAFRKEPHPSSPVQARPCLLLRAPFAPSAAPPCNKRTCSKREPWKSEERETGSKGQGRGKVRSRPAFWDSAEPVSLIL